MHWQRSVYVYQRSKGPPLYRMSDQGILHVYLPTCHHFFFASAVCVSATRSAAAWLPVVAVAGVAGGDALALPARSC